MWCWSIKDFVIQVPLGIALKFANIMEQPVVNQPRNGSPGMQNCGQRICHTIFGRIIIGNIYLYLSFKGILYEKPIPAVHRRHIYIL